MNVTPTGVTKANPAPRPGQINRASNDRQLTLSVVVSKLRMIDNKKFYSLQWGSE